MGPIASQITIVYAIVYSDADLRKHQSSASLAFVWGLHRDRWIPRTKGQLRGKYFHLMTSSWLAKGKRESKYLIYSFPYWNVPNRSIIECNSFGSVVLDPLVSFFNTLRPRQNGRHFADDNSICIFLHENFWISNKMSLKCVSLDLIKKGNHMWFR